MKVKDLIEQLKQMERIDPNAEVIAKMAESGVCFSVNKVELKTCEPMYPHCFNLVVLENS